VECDGQIIHPCLWRELWTASYNNLPGQQHFNLHIWCKRQPHIRDHTIGDHHVYIWCPEPSHIPGEQDIHIGHYLRLYLYTGTCRNRTRVVEDSGRMFDYSYDALYRLTQEEKRGQSLPLDKSLSFDNVERLEHETELKRRYDRLTVRVVRLSRGKI